MPLLDREEYVEQAYFFRALRERLPQNQPLQEVLAQLGEEVLATTKMPLAIGFMLSELKHRGEIGTAMRKLAHYFTSFQTYVISEAENERGNFDMRMAIEILRYEAEYRSQGASRPGSFLYQFEALCRNRLRYERGLDAMADDPIYDEAWRTWLQTVRRQIGIVDIADLVYVRSQHYVNERLRRHQEVEAEVHCPVRRKGGENRVGESAQRPALPLRGAAASSGVPDRATSCSGRRDSPTDSAVDAAHGTAGDADQAAGG